MNVCEYICNGVFKISEEADRAEGRYGYSSTDPVAVSKVSRGADRVSTAVVSMSL